MTPRGYIRPSFRADLEYAHQTGDEWRFGAVQTDLAKVPLAERISDLPTGVLQYNNIMDTYGCASRGPLNILEDKLTWFHHNGMHAEIQQWGRNNGYVVTQNGTEVWRLNDAFIEILSGTTPTGNSMKAPLDAIRAYGVIPFDRLPLEQNMTWEQYMDPKRITQEMRDLGAEFKKRITIAYEQVPAAQFSTALTDDFLDLAVHAWDNPVNGVYQKSTGAINHVVAGINTEINIFDNYVPFVKTLAKDFNFFEWGYSLSITAQNPYPQEVVSVFDTLMKYGLLSYFASWYKDFIARMGDSVQRILGTGDYHPDRLGGAARSQEWPKVRAAHLLKEPACQVCGGTTKLNVHHKIPFNQNPALELDPDNLITLCTGSSKTINCHVRFGHLDDFRTKWNPDIEKDAALWRKRFLAKNESEITDTFSS